MFKDYIVSAAQVQESCNEWIIKLVNITYCHMGQFVYSENKLDLQALLIFNLSLMQYAIPILFNWLSIKNLQTMTVACFL